MESRAHRFRPRQVRFRRPQRLPGGVQTLRRQHGSEISPHDAGDDLHFRPPPFLDGELPRKIGGLDAVAGLAGVVDRLVERNQRLKVVQRVGTVQWADVEIVGAELVLRQQRAENENGVVAAGEGFGIVQFREPPRAGLFDPCRGGAKAGIGRRDGLVLPQRQPHGFAQRERILGAQWRGQEQE
jgi:hypothetical protein